MILKHKLLKILKFFIFLAIGCFLFWLVYKDQNINRIKSILENGVDYRWVWLSLFLGILSHISRTIRWSLMIEPLGKKPRMLNVFLSVMVGYLMNLIIPRMGEISRCGVLARYEKMSFTKLLGTVVTERITDVIMLLILTIIVVVSQFGKIIQFLQNNPDILAKADHILFSPTLIIVVVAIVVFVVIFRKNILKSAFFEKLKKFITNFAEGLKSINKMKNKGWFIFHSVFIWLMYYLMLYVVFFSFSFTSHLLPIAGLTTFVLGSYGMVAPVQGGIGAWHFMVTQSLMVYGVAKSNGLIFAFLAFSSMTALMVVMGLISLMVLPFVNKRKQ
ncbi:MAG: flippase-like domain-containing protein [Prolixibacteraceae bacterium]|nr:flippase-like domain-containing protein [Prolixibacteraceae bacterium]